MGVQQQPSQFLEFACADAIPEVDSESDDDGIQKVMDVRQESLAFLGLNPACTSLGTQSQSNDNAAQASNGNGSADLQAPQSGDGCVRELVFEFEALAQSDPETAKTLLALLGCQDTSATASGGCSERATPQATLLLPDAIKERPLEGRDTFAQSATELFLDQESSDANCGMQCEHRASKDCARGTPRQCARHCFNSASPTRTDRAATWSAGDGTPTSPGAQSHGEPMKVLQMASSIPDYPAIQQSPRQSNAQYALAKCQYQPRPGTLSCPAVPASAEHHQNLDPYYMARMQQNWSLFGLGFLPPPGPAMTTSFCTTWSDPSSMYHSDIPITAMDKAPLPIQWTTVMLRDIPCRCNQQDLLEAIYAQGFKGMFDFFYLPIDFYKRCSMGYAFINFRSPLWAQEFMEKFQGLRLAGFSQKMCRCSWAKRQGWDANVEVYRNGSLNREDTPLCYSPLVFDELGDPHRLPDPDVPRECLPRIQMRPPRTL